MEVYTLTPDLLLRDTVIDDFVSLVWTDRFRDLGDFKMTLMADNPKVAQLTGRTMLAMNNSTRVMLVENIQKSRATDGSKTVTISGNSLEKVLIQRTAKQSFEDLTAKPEWVLTSMTPAAAARYIFQKICIEGLLKTADIIPLVDSGAIYPVDTILEDATVLATIKVPPKTVFDAIRDICEVYDMGFRLIRNPTTGRLRFDVYCGRNRTSGQTVDQAIIFSEALDTLTNTNELVTVEEEMNAAYVFSPAGTAVVYTSGTDDTTSGFNRKVLFVDASDYAVTTPATPPATITADLTLRGEIALAEHRALMAFDGETNQHGGGTYGVYASDATKYGYNVGDLVEERNTEGIANYLRVTEQIMTCDAEGDKSYPTLTKVMSAEPGSWVLYSASTDWDDLPTTVGPPSTLDWDDLPPIST